MYVYVYQGYRVYVDVYVYIYKCIYINTRGTTPAGAPWRHHIYMRSYIQIMTTKNACVYIYVCICVPEVPRPQGHPGAIYDALS